MEKQESLTAAQLALYFDCKVKTDYGIGSIDSIASYNSVFVCFDNGDEYETVDVPIDEVKPILRKLSSLTEEEAKRMYEIVTGMPVIESRQRGGFGSMLEYLHSTTKFRLKEITMLCGHPPTWQYLLSIGIDLFGWIDVGLAIDAETIKD